MVRNHPMRTGLDRFLVSRRGTFFFGNVFCNLEYWLNIFPALKSQGVIGAIDFVENVGNGNYVVRGWFFCCNRPVKKLSLIINDKTLPVFCRGLLRLDVAKALSCFPNARFSGFVLYGNGVGQIATPSAIGFRAECAAEEGEQPEIVEGSFIDLPK